MISLQLITKASFSSLIIVSFVFEVLSTIAEYKNSKYSLVGYMDKIVRVISTGETYLAIDFSLNLAYEKIVYITDVRSGKVLEVHPNEITIVKELTLIGE